jgi:hypothetical protein
MKYDDTSKQWCELEYKATLNKIYHSIRDALYNDAPQEKNPSDAKNNLPSSSPLGKQNSMAARQGMGRSFHLPLHGNQARATPPPPSISFPIDQRGESMNRADVSRGRMTIDQFRNASRGMQEHIQRATTNNAVSMGAAAMRAQQMQRDQQANAPPRPGLYQDYFGFGGMRNGSY